MTGHIKWKFAIASFSTASSSSLKDMIPDTATAASIAITILVTIFLLSPCIRRHSLHYLRGPPSQSWLWGNALEMSNQENVGDLPFRWMRAYGTAWRIKDFIGGETLMVADPQAIQHIFQKSGYDYPKRQDIRILARVLMGRGLIWARGDVHKRQRKIMDPIFTMGPLRSYFPTYQKNSSKEIIVNKWLAKTTLDIIGQIAFRYDFGALDDEKNEVVQAFDNLILESLLHPSKFAILFQATWNYVPQFLLHYVEYLPTREFVYFRHSLCVLAKYSRRLIMHKRRNIYAEEGGKMRDAISILVKANAAENPKQRLSDEEMIAQISTLTLAGHETISTTLSFLLWELAKAPAYQLLMREEILATREKLNKGSEFSMEELDGMTYTVAAIKETLRLHPAVHELYRTAAKDDVIPISNPKVTTKHGQVLSEIPISAGQNITISVSSYNRLPGVWGKDADNWNPHRFLDSNPGRRNAKTGLYANLMTFSAGVHGCIGWRSAVIELQVIAVQLVENLQFSLPDRRPEIIRVSTIMMTPMVRDEMELGAALPLLVSLVSSCST